MLTFISLTFLGRKFWGQVISPPVITLIFCASPLSKIPSVISPPIFFNTFLLRVLPNKGGFKYYLSPDPALFVFLEKLKEFQIDTYVKIQSLHLVAKFIISMSETDKNL
jgi:hypothetical protein